MYLFYIIIFKLHYLFIYLFYFLWVDVLCDEHILILIIQYSHINFIYIYIHTCIHTYHFFIIIQQVKIRKSKGENRLR